MLMVLISIVSHSHYPLSSVIHIPHNLLILPHRPPLLRLRTQRPPRHRLQPPLRPHHLPDPSIRLPFIPPKQLMPIFQPLAHLHPRESQILRMSILQFPLGHLLAAFRFLNILWCRVWFEFRVDRNEHLFYAAEIGDRVFGETTRQKGARGVAAGEDVVAATWAVGAGGGGDVVDCAV